MKISVIIPVYNSEKYIRKCLNSIINQTYKNWELIAIDDGSLDNSYSILIDYAKLDRRIIVFTQCNKGPGLTRNEGLKFITGDYIVFVDSDDYIEYDYFENLINKIIMTNADLVFIDVIQENPEGLILKKEFSSNYLNYEKERIIKHQLTGKLPWGGVRKVIKSSIVSDNKIEYSNDNVGEEALFSLRVLLLSENVAFLDKPSYHYVKYPNSQSTKGADDPWGPICRKIKNYLIDDNNIDRFKLTINSFAFTALIVSIYRIAQNYSFNESLIKSRISVMKYKEEYSTLLDIDSLETRVLVLLPLVKYNLVPIIVILAKLKLILSNVYK